MVDKGRENVSEKRILILKVQHENEETAIEEPKDAFGVVLPSVTSDNCPK